ncbi:MAG TPA: hypothetical protein DCZ12_12060 [Gammaproteobacteria bacterium]|nr:hypothetical protein [Gammaproteobacteria bacterium]
MSSEYVAKCPDLQDIIFGTTRVVVHRNGIGWALPGGVFTSQRRSAEAYAKKMHKLISGAGD